MLSSFRGVLAFALAVCNLILWWTPMALVAMARLLVPIPRFQLACRKALTFLAAKWISGNDRETDLMLDVEWDIEGLEGLSMSKWYLVVSNHRSWTDIVVLQRIFRGRIPFLRFFIKRELIWVPLLGLAWWALDFPFLRRYSKAQILADPSRRGADVESIRKACAKFSDLPTSVLVFAEGTRFTAAKRDELESPHRHLLPARPGGIGIALSTLGERFDALVDVTIAYSGPSGIWNLLCGRLESVHVRVRPMELPPAAIGDMPEDRRRQILNDWLAEVWTSKDEILEELQEE